MDGCRSNLDSFWIDQTQTVNTLKAMEVQLTVEQEAQLSRLADQTGRSAEELAREALGRYIAEETQFRAAVQAGQDAADRGDFVPTSEVWARVERALKV